MSNAKYLEFPWLKFLWNCLFWSYIAAIIMRLFLIIAPIIFDQFEDSSSSAGSSSASVNFSFTGSLDIVVGMTLSLLFASVLLIPSFYAGMFACVRLENKGGAYENQYTTTFRVTSTLVFILVAGLMVLIFKTVGTSWQDIGIRSVFMIILFYIFDETVTEQVWPEIFEKRE